MPLTCIHSGCRHRFLHWGMGYWRMRSRIGGSFHGQRSRTQLWISPLLRPETKHLNLPGWASHWCLTAWSNPRMPYSLCVHTHLPAPGSHSHAAVTEAAKGERGEETKMGITITVSKDTRCVFPVFYVDTVITCGRIKQLHKWCKTRMKSTH